MQVRPPESQRDAATKKADAERVARRMYVSHARERLIQLNIELGRVTHSSCDKQARHARVVADQLEELASQLRAGATNQEGALINE